MMQLPDVPTPALVLDLDVLERNLSRMAERCRELGVALRPHAKTHKCVEVGRRQVELGAVGLTVATLPEARAFAAAGVGDLTWAFPLPPARAADAAELAEGTTLRLLVDSPEAVDALEATGARLHAWLKVDCGYGRVGVDPQGPRAVELARRLAASPGLLFDGLLTHSGQAYAARGEEALAAAAEEERRVMAALAERLRGEGIAVPGVSVGSTPAMSAARRLDGVTEARPGNYALFDGSMVSRGACSWGDCAATVLATVVSCQPGASHSVVDAGALALSKDAGAGDTGGIDTGMGVLVDEEGRPTGGRLTSLSQEHGVVDRPLPVGERVRVVPNHSCLAVACFDRYELVRGGRSAGRWSVYRER